jgi:hypothetical protein
MAPTLAHRVRLARKARAELERDGENELASTSRKRSRALSSGRKCVDAILHQLEYGVPERAESVLTPEAASEQRAAGY